MFQKALLGFLFGLLLAVLPGVCLAQSMVLDLPLQSQRAQVSQRIGITDITINYHRPLINDRKVWGDLVPNGKFQLIGKVEDVRPGLSLDRSGTARAPLAL